MNFRKFFEKIFKKGEKGTPFFEKFLKEIHRIANFGSVSYRGPYQNRLFFPSVSYKGLFSRAPVLENLRKFKNSPNFLQLLAQFRKFRNNNNKK